MVSSVTVPKPETVRLEALTGLRWLAAFWVFGYHLMNFAPLPTIGEIPFRLGFLGVTFFFVLSGFVLTWSFRPSVSMSTFYTRRFARIWPAHFVTLLLAIPVFYSITVPDPAQTWVKDFSFPILLLSVVLVQGFSRNQEILFSGNPAAWTLTCEMFFYAAHPFLSRFLTRLAIAGALVVAAGTLVVAFGYRAATMLDPGAWWSALMPWPVIRITEFVLGMAIAWAIRQGWRPRLPLWIGATVFTVIMVWLTLGPDVQPYSVQALLSAGFSNEFATLACGVLITSVAVHSLRGRRTWLATTWMVKLGNWSYSFYLVHAIVIYAVMNVLGRRGPGWSNLLWGLAIFLLALVLAYLVYRFVERPVEQKIRSWKDNRDKANITKHSRSKALS